MPVRSAAALLAVALAVACASPPPAPAGPEVLVGSVGQNLLVLPLNIAVAMPPRLEATSPIVWEELERYLRDQGKELKTVSKKDAAALWAKSVAEVQARASGKPAGYDAAARVLVQKLSAYADFDTVIAPSIFIREAPVYERMASWDGVERDVAVEAIGDDARTIAAETPLEGAAPASSIHIVVLDSIGNKVQEAQGGLDLLVRVRVTTDSGKPEFDYVRKSDVLADREHIREGIAVALAPFLPRL